MPDYNNKEIPVLLDIVENDITQHVQHEPTATDNDYHAADVLMEDADIETEITNFHTDREADPPQDTAPPPNRYLADIYENEEMAENIVRAILSDAANIDSDPHSAENPHNTGAEEVFLDTIVNNTVKQIMPRLEKRLKKMLKKSLKESLEQNPG